MAKAIKQKFGMCQDEVLVHHLFQFKIKDHKPIRFMAFLILDKWKYLAGRPSAPRSVNVYSIGLAPLFPRIHAELKRKGFGWGLHRVARLMKTAGIKAFRQYYYKRHTLALTDHGRIESPNLVNQNFEVKKPNRIWASDITQFRIGAGWLYLAVVMDLYSRRIIGWSMKTTLREELAIDALDMAVQARGEETPQIHHSDRGSQYTSRGFLDKLKEYRIKSSMNQRGSCYDNAVVESFFKTLKAELVRAVRLDRIEDTRMKLFEFIEVFYNRKRLHSSLGYKSPVEFEAGTTLN